MERIRMEEGLEKENMIFKFHFQDICTYKIGFFYFSECIGVELISASRYLKFQGKWKNTDYVLYDLLNDTPFCLKQ